MESITMNNDNKTEERQIVAHSILLFFAMDEDKLHHYLPAIDSKIEYIADGDTGDRTTYPAYYFCMRAMDYLSVYPPRCGRRLGDMLYEMRELIYFMSFLSPDPPFDIPSPESARFLYIWLFGPTFEGLSGTGRILWRFLRRYARMIVADPEWKFDYPLLSFHEISEYFTVYT